MYLNIYSFSLRIMSVSSTEMNPPKAPKKKSDCEDCDILPIWQQLRKSGKVRSQWAFYTPEDVQEIDDKKNLVFLLKQYLNPPSWEENDAEWTYFCLMSWCLVRKLESFKDDL